MFEKFIISAQEVLTDRAKCQREVVFLGRGASLDDFAQLGAQVIEVRDEIEAAEILEKLRTEAAVIFVSSRLIRGLGEKIRVWNQGLTSIVVLPEAAEDSFGFDLMTASVKRALGTDISAEGRSD